jgi:hypothetical protein
MEWHIDTFGPCIRLPSTITAHSRNRCI